MKEEGASLLLFRTCLVGTLLGIVATFYLLGGLAGYVSSPVFTLPVAAVLTGAVMFFLVFFSALPWQTNRVGRAIWAAILIILVVEAMLGFLPPTARDELTHHLAIPRLYARAGRIIEVPMALHSYYPMLLDMLYTPWVYWGYDFVPKFIHGLFAFLTGLCIYAYLTRRMNPVYGLLGFFLFVSTPIVLRLSHWAYVDLGVTFYSTASLLCLLRWREEQEQLKWLMLSALSMGFALATKPNAMVACLILFFLFLLLIVNAPTGNWIKSISRLALFSLLVLLPFLPWLIKNWVQTRNPFYPLLAGLFPVDKTDAGEAASFVGLGILERREFLYGESFWQIAILPLRVFFSGQDDNPQYFDGVLTPILIVLLPWAFKGKWIGEKQFLTGFAFLYFIYALLLADLRVRYILLMVPSLIVLAVYGVFNIYLRIKQPVYLIAGLLLFAGWHGSYLWQYVRNAAPSNYLRGHESRDAFLTRMLPDYPVFQYMNQDLSLNSKIYLLFMGRRTYYCERDYFHDGGELPGFLLTAIQTAKKSEQINETLKRKNITHLMIREDLLKRYLMNNLTPSQGGLWNDYVKSHVKLLFRHGDYALYQVHG